VLQELDYEIDQFQNRILVVLNSSYLFLEDPLVSFIKFSVEILKLFLMIIDHVIRITNHIILIDLSIIYIELVHFLNSVFDLQLLFLIVMNLDIIVSCISDKIGQIIVQSRSQLISYKVHTILSDFFIHTFQL